MPEEQTKREPVVVERVQTGVRIERRMLKVLKAIAEQNGVPVPSFVEFVLKYSLPCLLPVLAIVWLVFFRG